MLPPSCNAMFWQINGTRGLGFDAWDLDFYETLFRDKLKRDPTDVELFDMGQANSEHSRHWFFSGKMVIDGEEQDKTLFKLVKDTLPKVFGSMNIPLAAYRHFFICLF